MSATLLLQHRPRLAETYRRLLRLIHGEGIAPGERLPGQRALSVRLGSPEQTVFEALHLLVKEGVLERSRSEGTRLLDLSLAKLRVWTVAMPLYRMGGEVTFSWVIWHMLRERLLDSQCEVPTFLRQEGVPERRPGAMIRDLVGFYPELEAALAVGGGIDLLAGPFILDDAPLPVCVGGEGAMSNRFGVYHDLALDLSESCLRLREDGAAKVAFVYPKAMKNRRHDRQKEALFQKMCKRTGLNMAAEWALGSGNGIEDGVGMGKQLLALRPSARPDALVVTNDRLGLGLASVLREAPDYRPRMVVFVNEEMPQIFGFPVMERSLVIAEYVEAMRRLIHGVLLSGERAPREVVALTRRWKEPLERF